MTRVFVADANIDTRSALRLLLVDMQMQVVGEAVDWHGAMAKIPTTSPDMLVVSWELPAEVGAALAQLRVACPNLRVLVLSSQLGTCQDAFHAGADEFTSIGNMPDRVTEHLRAAAGNRRSE